MMRLQRCCRQQLPPVKCRHVISEAIRHQRPLRKKGVVEYLDDYIAADPDFDKDDIIDAFLDYCRDDEGHVYSLPAWGTTQVVYYGKICLKKWDWIRTKSLQPGRM